LSELEFISDGNAIAEKQYQYFQMRNRQDQKAQRLLSQRSCWVNTSRTPLKDARTGKIILPRMIYADLEEHVENGDPIPNWDVPVMNLDKAAEADQKRMQGAYASMTEIDKAFYDPWTPEFQEHVKGYKDALMALSTADAHTSGDYALINNVAITGVLVNTSTRNYIIQNAVTVENTTDLMYKEFSVDGFEIDEEVGELGESEPKKMAFASKTFLMAKAQGEIQWSDEFLMQNWIFDPLALARQFMTGDADRVKAKKTAKMFTTFGVTAGGADVTAYATNTEHSNFNPLPLLAKIQSTIEQTYAGTLDSAVMNPLTWQYLNSNSYIKGVGTAQTVQGSNNRTVTLPTLPGVTIYLENLAPVGVVYFYDKRSTIRKQGPIRTEQFRMARIGGNGLLYRDWHNMYLRDANLVTQINSLAPP
jgi:hypothetical protein